VGAVTRAVASPSLETPIALALVDFDLDATSLSIRDDAIDADVASERITLPFVEGSAASARLPTYAAD